MSYRLLQLRKKLVQGSTAGKYRRSQNEVATCKNVEKQVHAAKATSASALSDSFSFWGAQTQASTNADRNAKYQR